MGLLSLFELGVNDHYVNRKVDIVMQYKRQKSDTAEFRNGGLAYWAGYEEGDDASALTPEGTSDSSF